MMKNSTTALIVIDMQKGMAGTVAEERNNPDAERNILALLSAWRSAHQPVFAL